MEERLKPQQSHQQRRGVVSIRAYRPSDAEDLQRAANHAEVSKNLRDGFPFPYTLDDARWWIDRCISEASTNDNNKSRTFAIALDDVVVGGIGLVDSPEAEAMSSEDDGGCPEEIGYWLTPSEWSKGIATKALELLISRARRRDLPLRTSCRAMMALPDVENYASRRVLEHCGFVAQQGELVDVKIKDDRTSKSVLYRLVL